MIPAPPDGLADVAITALAVIIGCLLTTGLIVLIAGTAVDHLQRRRRR